MSLISAVLNDPFTDVGGMELLQPFMDFGFDTGQPNRYRHHYHRHRAHRYRQRGRGGTEAITATPEVTNILPLSSTLKEDDEKYTLLVDIPGLSKEQCSLKLENDVLTITATPTREDIEMLTGGETGGGVETKEGVETIGGEQPSTEGRSASKEKIVWSERPMEPTVRKIPIPVGVELGKIAAKEEHGVLYVYMPKDPNFMENQARRIEVG